MKSINALIYLLFVLIIMGAFASMAQNSYGLKLLGGVAIAFGMIFLFRFIRSIFRYGIGDYIKLSELFCLALLSFLFAVRIFHIYLPVLEWLFSAVCIILIFIYGNRMILHAGRLYPKNATLAAIILLYYLSLVLFFIALAFLPFLPVVASYIGALAFILFTGVLIAALLSRKFLIDGEEISVIGQVYDGKDYSVILLSMFFIMSLYTGLSRVGILPSLYSDDYPQAYFTLVDQAESGKEESKDGSYRHEEFKKKYNDFIEKNLRSTQSPTHN